MLKNTLFLAVLLCLLGSNAALAQPSIPSHAIWDTLLTKHVSPAGKVDYRGFKKDKPTLDAYLKRLAANPPRDSWPIAAVKAYWLNAYNAFTVNLIVENYPTSSILKFDGGKTWDIKRIVLDGRKYSLNQIENEIIRPQFKDPRIHFALNCAAQSCPPLWNHAFTADDLDAVLDERARLFINNPKYNSLAAGKASVSKIFDWYGTDFGDLRQFLNRYAEQVKLKKGASIQFQDYNWDLND